MAQINEAISATKLPPLALLIDSAYNNSPLLQSQALIINQKKILTKIQKKAWLNSLSFNNNYSRGTINAQNEGLIISNDTKTSSDWYNTGLSFNISLSTILNRKNTISISKINHEIEKNNLEEAKKALRKLILELYTAVILNEKILKIRNDAITISNVNFSYAEIEYKNNTITLGDYIRVSEAHIKSNIYYEESKRDYLLSIAVLEETAGVKIR